MSRGRGRVYCAVYGCLNSSILKPDLSFFKLPADFERRSKWLRLILREDLGNKPSQNYTICGEHFDAQDILPGLHRKKLKTNSLPCHNLPILQNRKDLGTQTEAPTLAEKCIETEGIQVLLANKNIQTPKSLSSNSPRKRKLKTDPLECTKKIKLRQNENKTKHKRDKFHKMCDRFLTKELAELVKAQTHLKFNFTGNRCQQHYKMFCLNLYYTSSQAYRLLQNAICLPCPNTLIKHGVPISTEINDRLISILRSKVEAMTDLEKNCSVVIDIMSLKANLLYNIKQDKIIGFDEIDGVQSPEPAKNALVVMIRGIYVNWKQPVGFALLSESRNYDEIAQWIDKLLEKLFEIGLNIKTFVTDMESDLYNEAKRKSVTIEQPYFFVKNRKVYYIFDAPHLIKLVRNNLMVYNFHFNNGVAKYEHIEQFYHNDKQKSFKLANKLTNSHIHPTNLEKMNVVYATQLLSNSVAAGISTYVDFKVIEESGRDTAKFISIIYNLFDALNSSNQRDNNEFRQAFIGKESQITFFNEMISFFQSLRLLNPKTGKDVTTNVNFIQGFQITIKSILMLYEDTKESEGCSFILTRRLNRDVLENLFGQIRTQSNVVTEPTSTQFISAFRKLYYTNIMNPPKGGNCSDALGKFLIHTSNLNQQNEGTLENKQLKDFPDPIKEEPGSNVTILSSDYDQLDLPENNSLVYVCSYLLKKCAERHKGCTFLQSYIKPDQSIHNFDPENRYLRYRDYSKNNNITLLIVPQDNFVKYIEKMDEKFLEYFQRENLNCKVAASIYKEIDEISFAVPCSCFPSVYLKKLFIRMRIFYTIKFNNRVFRTSRSRRKYFSVTNL